VQGNVPSTITEESWRTSEHSLKTISHYLHTFAGMSDFIVKDSSGNQLNDGDSVTLIKSLKVKGGGTTLKQGTLVKKIRLTDNDEEVDCKVDGMSIVLRTEFLKKR
jgi:protein PhnA